MIQSRRLLYAVAAWTALGFAASLWPVLAPLWQGGGLALLLAGGADAWLSRTPPPLRIERRLAGVWPVEVWNGVTLT